MKESGFDSLLWRLLQKHYGHHVEVAVYGDPNDPHNISLECTDCQEVILDAGIYTICARDDT